MIASIAAAASCTGLLVAAHVRGRDAAAAKARASAKVAKKAARGPQRGAKVRLIPVTRKNFEEVCDLRVGNGQDKFVASNVESLVEAHFNPYAWPRAIEANGTLVGFLMMQYMPIDPALRDSVELGEAKGGGGGGGDDDDVKEFARMREKGHLAYLWRMMIDRKYQGRGFAGAALKLAIAETRRRGYARMSLTYSPGPGSPQGFYARLGFEDTGEVDGGGGGSSSDSSDDDSRDDLDSDSDSDEEGDGKELFMVLDLEAKKEA